jgi:Mor family transcriptional regulator
MELAEMAAQLLATRGGLPPGKAEDIATELADQVAAGHGGFVVYIPKGNWNGRALQWHELEERDLKISQEYDGTNRRELCDRYSIGASRFYQIIRAVRRQHATGQVPVRPPCPRV